VQRQQRVLPEMVAKEFETTRSPPRSPPDPLSLTRPYPSPTKGFISSDIPSSSREDRIGRIITTRLVTHTRAKVAIVAIFGWSITEPRNASQTTIDPGQSSPESPW